MTIRVKWNSSADSAAAASPCASRLPDFGRSQAQTGVPVSGQYAVRSSLVEMVVAMGRFDQQSRQSQLQFVTSRAPSAPLSGRPPLIHARMLSIIALRTMQVRLRATPRGLGFSADITGCLLLTNISKRCSAIGEAVGPGGNYLPRRPLSPGAATSVTDTIVRKRGDVVVLHFVGQMPLAGIAWQAMHYLLGLEKLGYRAWYIEDGGANPFDPRINSVAMECSYNVRYLRRVMESQGFGERWSYWDAINDVRYGLSREQVHALYARADALMNLCGATQLRDEHLACPVRIMIDTDPVYEQIKYAMADRGSRAYLDAHTHFFTYGENLGAEDCPVPLSGDAVACDPASGGARASGLQRLTRRLVSRRSRPGRTRARTSISTARATSGRSISTLSGFSTCPSIRPANCFRMAMLPPDDGVRPPMAGTGWSLVDPRPISADMAGLPRFHRPFARRVHGGKGHLRAAQQRLVQRPQRLLSRRRPAGSDDAHGVQQILPGRAGLFEYSKHGRGAGRHRRDRCRLPRPQPRGAANWPREYFASDRVIGALLAAAAGL